VTFYLSAFETRPVSDSLQDSARSELDIGLWKKEEIRITANIDKYAFRGN
jgi:hypothetical protein